MNINDQPSSHEEQLDELASIFGIAVLRLRRIAQKIGETTPPVETLQGFATQGLDVIRDTALTVVQGG